MIDENNEFNSDSSGSFWNVDKEPEYIKAIKKKYGATGDSKFKTIDKSQKRKGGKTQQGIIGKDQSQDKSKGRTNCGISVEDDNCTIF